MQKVFSCAIALLPLALVALVAQAAAPTPDPAPAAAWGPCPADLPARTVCANVTVPLQWTDRSVNGDAHIFAARLVAFNMNPTATIWYFGEGCSITNDANEWFQYLLQQGFYVAVVDIRGTGRSVPQLSCDLTPGARVPDAPCAASLAAQHVEYFGLSSIARDVNEIVSALGSKGANFALADSFGALVVQRTQSLFPALFDRVIMSSFTAPDRFDLFETAFAYESVVRRVLQYCERIPQCAGRAGGGADLVQTLSTVMLAAAQGTLPIIKHMAQPAGVNASNTTYFKQQLGRLFATLAGPTLRDDVPQRDLQAFIPALLYRIQRGAPQDGALVDAIVALGNVEQPPTCANSLVVRTNILLNEFVRRAPPSLENMLANMIASSVPPRSEYFVDMWLLRRAWPTYDVPDADRRYTTSTAPTLLLAGDTDVATPFDLAVYSQLFYTAPNFNFVALSQTPHRALYTSANGDSAVTCVLLMVAPFFQGKALPPCAANMTALDFLGVSPATLALRQQYFGNAAGDMWNFTALPDGNIPTLPPAPVPVPTPAPTTVAPSPTTAAPTPSPDNGTHVKSNVGAIVGGIFGTAAGLALIGLLWHKCARGRSASNAGTRDFYGALQK